MKLKTAILTICTIEILTLFSLCAENIFNNNAQQQQRPQHRFQYDPTAPSAHDPVMIKCGERYYLFCTGMGISMFVSDNMREWQPYGGVFEEAPAWTKEAVPGFRGHMWAPDIIYHNGKYHLYYSCSSFGKNHSAIGHAENVTLDKSSPDYKWHDTGMVIQSITGRDNWNAIDPNVIIDEQGQGWFSFGSFWGGIKLFKMNEELTAPHPSQEWATLAVRNSRASQENPIEAPFIFRHGDYYYLFVSIDYCCKGKDSTYKMAVGRSKNVKGPYLDREGQRMDRGGHTLINSSNEKWVASGHCGVHHIDGKDYLAAHAYEATNGRSILVVREIEWDAEGWPNITL